MQSQSDISVMDGTNYYRYNAKYLQFNWLKQRSYF